MSCIHETILAKMISGARGLCLEGVAYYCSISTSMGIWKPACSSVVRSFWIGVLAVRMISRSRMLEGCSRVIERL